MPAYMGSVRTYDHGEDQYEIEADAGVPADQQPGHMQEFGGQEGDQSKAEHGRDQKPPVCLDEGHGAPGWANRAAVCRCHGAIRSRFASALKRAVRQ